MSLQPVLDQVPFVAHTGLQVEDYAPGRVVLSLPTAAHVQNHVGSVHAGALFLLAETAASAACATHPQLANLRLLARNMDIRFKKPARGGVTAHAEVTEDMARAVRQGIARLGKHELEVLVELLDGHGGTVAQARGVYSFRPRAA